MKGEADAAVAAYEQELAEARAKANAIGQKARDAAKAEAEADAQDGRGRASSRSSPRPRPASPRSRPAAMKEVGTIAEDTAAAIVEQLVGGKVDKADVAAAVKSVTELRRMDATSTATFWALVALVIFLGVVVYIKVPGMIAKALDARADKIRNELDEARRLREEAQQLLAEYQQKRKEAEKEAADIVAAAKREADMLVGEAHKKTEDYVARRTALAEQKIAQAERDAVNEVRAKRRRHRRRGGARAARRQGRHQGRRRTVQVVAAGSEGQAELSSASEAVASWRLS